MSVLSLHSLSALLHEYGYITIFLCIMLESIGAPLPAESIMVAAAIDAAVAHDLSIYLLVPAAAAGAIVGDQIGYFFGRWIGFPTLKRWGRKVGLTDERLELGRFLFHKYGGGIVFVGRFIVFLRTFAALLAGANRMSWHSFLVWNGLGGICWTSLYGFGAYLVGDAARKISGPLGLILFAIGGTAIAAAVIFIRRNQARLLAEAKRDAALALTAPS